MKIWVVRISWGSVSEAHRMELEYVSAHRQTLAWQEADNLVVMYWMSTDSDPQVVHHTAKYSVNVSIKFSYCCGS